MPRAASQPDRTASQPLTAPASAVAQAAVAEARTNLRVALTKRAIFKGSTIGGLLADGRLRDGFLDAAIDRAIECGPPIAYANGVCEARLMLRELALHETVERFRAGSAVFPSASAPAANRVAMLVSGCVSRVDAGGAPTAAPWSGMQPGSHELALCAARLEARLELLERIRPLQLIEGVRVADLLTDAPRLEWNWRAAMPAQSFGEPRYGPDGICRIDAVISIESVAAGLAEWLEQNANDRVTAAQARRMPRLNGPTSVCATGAGAPPSAIARQALDRLKDRLQPAAPAWALDIARSEGLARYDARLATDPAARLAALQAARFDARRHLAYLADNLPCGGKQSLRDVMLAHVDLAQDAERWLESAIDAGPPRESVAGELRIELMLPLQPLWWIVRPYVPAGVDSQKDRGG